MPRVRLSSQRLASLAGPIRDEVFPALYAAGDIIATDAALSITRGSVSGKGHVPSRPGEPPNADTRALDTSIHVVADRASMKVQVVEDAPHAAPLEFGTSKMAARPHMRPALARNRDEVASLVSKAVRRAIQRKT